MELFAAAAQFHGCRNFLQSVTMAAGVFAQYFERKRRYFLVWVLLESQCCRYWLWERIMSRRFASSLFASAALWLGFATYAPVASASTPVELVSVTATQASGAPGSDVTVSMNIGNGGGSSFLNTIASYDLGIYWNPLVLQYQSASLASGGAPLSDSTPDHGADYLAFHWADMTFSAPADLSAGMTLSATFHILGTAPLGNSGLEFGLSGFPSSVSSLNPAGPMYSEFTFVNVTSGPSMSVTVVPEPETLPLLLAGLAVVIGMVRRRNAGGRV